MINLSYHMNSTGQDKCLSRGWRSADDLQHVVLYQGYKHSDGPPLPYEQWVPLSVVVREALLLPGSQHRENEMEFLPTGHLGLNKETKTRAWTFSAFLDGVLGLCNSQ